MYEFILNQWILRQIDAAKVQSYVPMWIDQSQANSILATPQIPEDV